MFFWGGSILGDPGAGSSPCCSKLSPMKIPSSQLAAPGSPRMGGGDHKQTSQSHGAQQMRIGCWEWQQTKNPLTFP